MSAVDASGVNNSPNLSTFFCVSIVGFYGLYYAHLPLLRGFLSLSRFFSSGFFFFFFPPTYSRTVLSLEGPQPLLLGPCYRNIGRGGGG